MDNYICNEIEKICGDEIEYDSYNHCIIQKTEDGWVDTHGKRVVVLHYGYKNRSVTYSYSVHVKYMFITRINLCVMYYDMLMQDYKILRIISSDRNLSWMKLCDEYQRICGYEFLDSDKVTPWESFRHDRYILFLIWALHEFPRYIRAKIIVWYVVTNCSKPCRVYVCATIAGNSHHLLL